MNIFEQASKEQLRFPAIHGTLNVEDLWNIHLSALDGMAVAYNAELENSGKETFLKKSKTAVNSLAQLRFDICKSILDSRVEDMDKAKKSKARHDKNQKIMELIVAKEDDVLKETSIEELRKMLEEDEE